MEWKQHWERWKEHVWWDQELKDQLDVITKDEAQLEDSFYKYLEFGTGGMRGVMGPGTNRMNRFTVRRAAEGLARLIEERGEDAKRRGTVIAFDSRHRSYDFALEAALTLGAHNIQVYMFQELRPTPVLSFAVRQLNAYAGIMITASHNPPEYNGFKVYGEDGGQFPPSPSRELMEKVEGVKNELTIPIADENDMKANRKLIIVGEDIDKAYNDELQTICLHPQLIQEKGSEISIVFTPLHGTANIPVTRALQTSGFTKVTVVKEQALPDPEFSTVKSPNPEEKEAFQMAMNVGESKDADLLIATDPDADRLGLAVKDMDNRYQVLTGNQTGALLLNYLLAERKHKGILPKNGVVLKTIVTSELGRKIAEDYGLHVVDTLTGFKFIAEKIKEYNKNGSYTFQFGYEESYGCLISDFVRDKDAVQAALTASEMALWYKQQGKHLYEVLEEIYQKYGYYQEDLSSVTLTGKDGIQKMQDIIQEFRSHPPKAISGKKIKVMEDYHTSERTFLVNGNVEKIELPVSDVLKFIREDESWFCIRPSGTEPKIKFYFGVQDANRKLAEEAILQLKMDVMTKVQRYLN
ncbi:phospho-sugar mutase [Alteribacillus iranensis]|uniref:Phosphoglucomutase n=1 Tax=Alteribacillus iranensis TaxID=930128 RepID=A0A1I1Z332_9BACI|nr:phospho-sugar mutase [Alteribacillus iranensis]SFE25972.1 alpha-phosphoglucomutase [Alteribacillus iranensis]